MRQYSLLITLLIADFFYLLYFNSTLSLSAKEAAIALYGNDILNKIVNFGVDIFGSENGARIPFILMHILSAILLYIISKDIVRREEDRLISIGIFLLLPGVNSAALLVNMAGVVMLLILLFIAIFYRYGVIAIALLPFYLWIDNSFAVLFLALMFYAMKRKDDFLLSSSLILFGISMFIYGFNIDGKPKGYFVDNLGVYLTIFSPLLFIYFFYTFYRALIKKKEDHQSILWYIGFTSMVFSFILSFRQRIDVEDFAPFVMIGIPVMVRIFYHSYRVRLKIFRVKQRVAAVMMLSVLLLVFSLFSCNRLLYKTVENPKDHFLYKYHVSKDLSKELKNKNIDFVDMDNKSMLLRLNYYGIETGKRYKISQSKSDKDVEVIKIVYFDTEVAQFFVSKINN